MAKAKAPVLRVGPCGVANGCHRKCEGWGPHPTYSDVWQTCWCGHSRGIHAVDLPKPPEHTEEEINYAVTVIAARALAARVLFALSVGEIEWGDYPEIGERDWARVESAVETLALDLNPSPAAYDRAYDLLKARADDHH